VFLDFKTVKNKDDSNSGFEIGAQRRILYGLRSVSKKLKSKHVIFNYKL